MIEGDMPTDNHKEPNDSIRGIVNRSNVSPLWYSIAIVAIIVVVTDGQHHDIAHPDSISGVGRVVTGISTGIVAALAAAVLFAALLTFWSRDVIYQVKVFYDALAERISFALIIATLTALISIWEDARDGDSSLDVVDIIARITTVVTAIAIATCIRLAAISIWKSISQLRPSPKARPGGRGGVAVAIFVIVSILAYCSAIGYSIGSLILTGHGFGR